MSLSSLYAMSRRSFSVYTAQMSVAGQNIANAGTPGYSRRRLALSPLGPPRSGIQMRGAQPSIGGGVSATHLSRMRDGLLDSAASDARTGLGGSAEETRLLGAMEGLFGVGSGGSLQDTMGGFWDAWGDLANNPTDLGVRSTLLGQAETAAAALNDLDDNLTRLAAETETGLSDSIDQVNGLLDEIASLNTQIQTAQAAGSPDLAAEDRRDAAVAELSAFVPVDVTPGDDGYTVTISGMAAVQGDQASGLTLDRDGDGPPSVRFEGTEVGFTSPDGAIGAQLRTLNETIPETRGALDAFAARLVTDVNAAHAAGYGLDGSTGLSFFDPDGLTAGSIRLSDDMGDPAAIAAASDPEAPGDSGVALLMGGLREGFDDELIGIVSGVGSKLSAARTAAKGHAAVANHLDALARGVSGVSIDEEMTHLIEAQRAFEAAARVLNTADEMMQTILAL